MNVTLRGQKRPFKTVSFDPARNQVRLIEQRLLPHRFKVIGTRDYLETARAIKDMVVRGAGAIGATAAYGLAQGARAFKSADMARFNKHLAVVYQVLKDARPTAVDPVNAMDQVLRQVQIRETVAKRQDIALSAAEQFAREDEEHCREIGRHGARLIRPGTNILTHCNAGWLAFVDVGSATAPIYEAHAEGRKFHVFCDETRPRCQGAMLTAWELAQEGVSHEVIADNAAGLLFARGKIDLVIVGSDRTLGRTGEVANKIGTYTKAVLAHRHGVPFYVAIPLSTIDWTMRSGKDIPIEERDEQEVLAISGALPSGRTARVRVANPTSKAFNPGFDVTPPDLITGIITPAGIFRPQDLWKNRARLGGA